MNTQQYSELFCIESTTKDSFIQLIEDLPSSVVHSENALITLPDATTCFGLRIDGDHDEGVDLLSLYCAQKGVVWGEFTAKTLYLSDGNAVAVESCSFCEYQ